MSHVQLHPSPSDQGSPVGLDLSTVSMEFSPLFSRGLCSIKPIWRSREFPSLLDWLLRCLQFTVAVPSFWLCWCFFAICYRFLADCLIFPPTPTSHPCFLPAIEHLLMCERRVFSRAILRSFVPGSTPAARVFLHSSSSLPVIVAGCVYLSAG